jgi:hypothetical protein
VIARDERTRWIAVAIVVAGPAALPGLWTDMWFDEVLSVQNADAAPAWWDLLLHFKTDNNHHLTSLYLYALGPSASAVAYRALSLAAGIATVPLAWLIGARQSRLAASSRRHCLPPPPRSCSTHLKRADMPCRLPDACRVA